MSNSHTFKEEAVNITGCCDGTRMKGLCFQKMAQNKRSFLGGSQTSMLREEGEVNVNGCDTEYNPKTVKNAIEEAILIKL